MRLDYINPFLEAAQSIFEEVLKMSVTKGRLQLCAEPVTSKGFVILSGLTGDVEGNVMFDMQPETALKIASTMNNAHFDSLEPLVTDTLAELVNLILGRTLTTLNDKGFDFRLTPPVVFTGNTVIRNNIRVETLVVPFVTEHGDFFINIALRSIDS